jgi:magnesium transporter
MITLYWRPGERVTEGSIDALKSKKVVWLDCFNPTREELLKISDMTGVEITEFLEHAVEYERPIIFESELYSLLVFAAPVGTDGSLQITSVAVFIFNNQNIVTIRTHEIEGMEKFRREILLKNPKFFDSPTKSVERMLEKVIDTYFAHLETLQDEAEKIESEIFKKQQKRKIMQEIFQIRKAAIVLHKSLIANREVVLSMEKQYLTRLSNKELRAFRDLYNDLVQLVDTTDTLRSILTGILDMYTSSMSNRLNQAIKKLTVITSYVLIPTLIASIYGMNFMHMPETDWVFGYPFAILLMIASTAIVHFYFKRVNML